MFHKFCSATFGRMLFQIIIFRIQSFQFPIRKKESQSIFHSLRYHLFLLTQNVEIWQVYLNQIFHFFWKKFFVISNKTIRLSIIIFTYTLLIVIVWILQNFKQSNCILICIQYLYLYWSVYIIRQNEIYQYSLEILLV